MFHSHFLNTNRLVFMAGGPDRPPEPIAEKSDAGKDKPQNEPIDSAQRAERRQQREISERKSQKADRDQAEALLKQSDIGKQLEGVAKILQAAEQFAIDLEAGGKESLAASFKKQMADINMTEDPNLKITMAVSLGSQMKGLVPSVYKGNKAEQAGTVIQVAEVLIGSHEGQLKGFSIEEKMAILHYYGFEEGGAVNAKIDSWNQSLLQATHYIQILQEGGEGVLADKLTRNLISVIRSRNDINRLCGMMDGLEDRIKPGRAIPRRVAAIEEKGAGKA